MKNKDHDHYMENEEAMEPAGPPARRSAPTLSSHVPIRFSPEKIAAIRRLASHEGMTVSTWIRRAVEREIERFLPPATVGRHFETRVIRPVESTRSQSTFGKTFEMERTG